MMSGIEEPEELPGRLSVEAMSQLSTPTTFLLNANELLSWNCDQVAKWLLRRRFKASWGVALLGSECGTSCKGTQEEMRDPR
jgi:hypothetical protein